MLIGNGFNNHLLCTWIVFAVLLSVWFDCCIIIFPLTSVNSLKLFDI